MTTFVFWRRGQQMVGVPGQRDTYVSVILVGRAIEAQYERATLLDARRRVDAHLWHGHDRRLVHSRGRGVESTRLVLHGRGLCEADGSGLRWQLGLHPGTLFICVPQRICFRLTGVYLDRGAWMC